MTFVEVSFIVGHVWEVMISVKGSMYATLEFG